MKSGKVRKLRPTENGRMPKDAERKRIVSNRTNQACSRATVFLERHQRIAFIRAMRLLKPQIEAWAKHVKRTQGKDSGDFKRIEEFWASMIFRYKSMRAIEAQWSEPPSWNPDIEGKIYG